MKNNKKLTKYEQAEIIINKTIKDLQAIKTQGYLDYIMENNDNKLLPKTQQEIKDLKEEQAHLWDLEINAHN